ncbi:MAG: methylated-DNA--[protein]-cysteine S-methyltransferase [Solirubrobacterales bacterium]
MTTIEIPSPVGPLALEARNGLLVALRFDGRGEGGAAAPGSELAAAAFQLAEYFSGKRRVFELPLAQPGAAFDREVLNVVGEIPCGERASYGQVTAKLGLRRDQVRKVAAAIGRNPLPILVACHRVVWGRRLPHRLRRRPRAKGAVAGARGRTTRTGDAEVDGLQERRSPSQKSRRVAPAERLHRRLH